MHTARMDAQADDFYVNWPTCCMQRWRQEQNWRMECEKRTVMEQRNGGENKS